MLPSTPHPRLRRPLPRLLAALGLLLLTGCDSQLQPMESRDVNFQGQDFTVVSLDLHRESLSLHWKNPDTGQAFGDIQSLREWGAANNKRLMFAANAGIYDQSFSPLGLYVEHGKTLVPLNLFRGNPDAGNFSIQPNGVFAIYPDGHAAVRSSTQFKADGKAVDWATQSGPMLVVDGQINNRFVDDSNSTKWRSGVCARNPYQAVFAVSEAPVNFHTFASLFRDKLGCRDALYLDGTISQFYIDGTGYAGAPTFMVKPYAGIFAVFANQ
ncbi:phosphodiester glycosidase family protein [Dyella acidiphila]|uniref:Phosphodiester glycosidase family protein n=1 Tax=Dyella acidiphila TaxID=2775866 RepID=A0ABR9GC84_9GAMM|nr:phosphodiester glycosidase family protein [Dyella acidiphila]MBE1161650.1 phosphodiester glycosidase family protein [Dyella acidiphila]